MTKPNNEMKKQAIIQIAILEVLIGVLEEMRKEKLKYLKGGKE